MQRGVSHKTTSVVGGAGWKENWWVLQPLKFKLGKQWVTHQFLYMPECPSPLLGRDILSKLNAQNNF